MSAVNDFVKKFLEANDPSNKLVKNWNSSNVQKELALCMSAAPKSASGKVVRDPKLPKRPANAYTLYQQDSRQAIKESNPKMSSAEIMKALAERWNNLSDREKQKYNDAAAKDKARYNSEMEHYVPTAGFPALKPRRSTNPDAPKRKPSVYILFASEQRKKLKADHPDWSADAIKARLSELWTEAKSSGNVSSSSAPSSSKQRSASARDTPARDTSARDTHESDDDDDESQESSEEEVEMSEDDESPPPPPPKKSGGRR